MGTEEMERVASVARLGVSTSCDGAKIHIAEALAVREGAASHNHRLCSRIERLKSPCRSHWDRSSGGEGGSLQGGRCVLR